MVADIKGITIVAEIFMIFFGLFLVVDSLFLHLIMFDYPKLKLAWLDPILNHWMIGVVLIVVGLVALYLSEE